MPPLSRARARPYRARNRSVIDLLAAVSYSLRWMTFTVQEFHDLVSLLERQPAWREELRRLLLSDELLELPQIVRQLVEAQRHTEGRLETLTGRVDQLAVRMDQLAERMDQLTERMDQLTERMDQLAERMDQLTERMDQLAERMDQLAERMDQLAVRMEELAEAQRRTETTVQRLVVQVGGLRGAEIERRYRERAPAYFAPFVRRIHALSVEEVAALLDELEARTPLDARDRAEILHTDLVVRGTRPADGVEMYLAVEVSAGIGLYDVERACERAQVLQRVTGKPAMGVVAGETITREGEDAVRRLHAWQVLDGRTSAAA
jgi:uncharacterized protein YoxC